MAVLAIAGTTWGAVAASSGGDARAAASAAEVSRSVLAADTRMGAVEISARDLAPMRSFYADAVGLDVLAEGDQVLSLGSDGEELVRVVPSDSPAATATDAGLYHTAILFPDAASLAGTLQNLARVAPQRYQGSADHLVSLAFYFGDPEGNGVELYVDTPRDQWEWTDGRVRMGAAALDPNRFIADHLGTAPASPATVGHVHLKVGDLAAARAFYVDALGFAVTSETNGALFMSAGGYHHHLAANTWGSAGAGVRGDTLGLAEFAVLLPDAGELEAAATRLDGARITYERGDSSLTVGDPWGNAVRLTVAA
ncbi:VOC family protein [Glaciibacter sp. 2TAF33]|uniref:VOC family protein n=1 Tax=Glaciibacter sp. 2TAF33 TaxID=3233015 RepID=UPI003F8E4E68